MLNKLLLMLVSFLSGRIFIGHETKDLADFGLDKIRQIGLALTGVTLCVSGFTLGLMLLLADLFYTSLQMQQLALSAISEVAFGLIAFSSLLLAICFRKKAWGIGQDSVRTAETQAVTNPLVDAASSLIMDFIQERQEQRSARSQQAEAYADGVADEMRARHRPSA